MRLRSFLVPAFAALLASASARADDAVDAVVQARQHCGVRDAALQPSGPLAEAARRIGQGEALADALRGAGYRARRSYQWSFGGYTSAQAVGQALASQCRALADGELREVGVWRQGTQWRIVAAVPFDPPPVARSADVAADVLQRVNQARSQPRRCGGQSFAAASPLALNAQLTQAAQAHAESMARFGYMEHRGRDGSLPQDRVTRAGYAWRSVGENIASGQTTAQRVVDDWLKSPEHCANIMEPRFAEMGLAFAVNPASEGGIYWAQTFGRR